MRPVVAERPWLSPCGAARVLSARASSPGTSSSDGRKRSPRRSYGCTRKFSHRSAPPHRPVETISAPTAVGSARDYKAGRQRLISIPRAGIGLVKVIDRRTAGSHRSAEHAEVEQVTVAAELNVMPWWRGCQIAHHRRREPRRKVERTASSAMADRHQVLEPIGIAGLQLWIGSADQLPAPRLHGTSAASFSQRTCPSHPILNRAMDVS